MDPYVTGSTIKTLRDGRELTQAALADMIGVSPKAVSKWETGRGLPDISLLSPLAEALGVSLQELMNGGAVVNRNISGNMLRSKIYICPVCGNIIHSMGEAVISCCGIQLPPEEAEDPDEDHSLTVEPVEDEYFVTVHHDMKKGHYISFIAFASSDKFELVKLYPEGNAETRLHMRGRGIIYYFCTKHGLMKIRK